MNILINGEKKEVADSVSVTTLLADQKVKMPDMVTVELNGEILKRDSFDSTVIADGDKVEFLYFMGGGAYKG